MTRRRSVGRRCLVAGCGRFAKSGRALCAEHERGAYGREVEEAVGRMARRMEAAFAAPRSAAAGKGARGEEDRAGPERAAGEFGRRVAGGAGGIRGVVR